MKVMIVDDNTEIRALIRTVLAKVASTFIECANGREAVAVYERERPDWTVMDVAMGVMDGLTATRLITSKYANARVVIITQNNHPGIREAARGAGAGEFLLKDDLLELPSRIAPGDAGDKETKAHHHTTNQ